MVAGDGPRSELADTMVRLPQKGGGSLADGGKPLSLIRREAPFQIMYIMAAVDIARCGWQGQDAFLVDETIVSVARGSCSWDAGGVSVGCVWCVCVSDGSGGGVWGWCVGVVCGGGECGVCDGGVWCVCVR
jgi:hypothetical protein